MTLKLGKARIPKKMESWWSWLPNRASQEDDHQLEAIKTKCLSRGATRVSMEVIITIVSKLLYFTYLGDVNNLLLGMIIHLLPSY